MIAFILMSVGVYAVVLLVAGIVASIDYAGRMKPGYEPIIGSGSSYNYDRCRGDSR